MEKMKKFWWFNNRNARFPFNNKGEVDTNPNPNPNPDPAPPATDPNAPAQPSVYTDLATKKGFKTQDDFAKNYTELEADRSRKDTTLNTVKQQLASQGMSLDDKGNIVQAQPAQPGVGQPVIPGQQGQPGQYQQQPFQQPAQPGYGQPQGDPIYDPYTGQQITNPLDLQLAQMPIGQRTAVIANAIYQQNEKHQTDADTAANEVLSQPTAKGFEDDVKKVMRQLPLQQRAVKAEWERALLQVKGAKFDQMKQNAGQDGVHKFINTQQTQNLPAGGGGGQPGGVKLTPEQEQNYQWYAQNRPGLFKDKAHFARRLQADGGGAGG